MIRKEKTCTNPSKSKRLKSSAIIYDAFERNDLVFGLSEHTASIGENLEGMGFDRIWSVDLNAQAIYCLFEPSQTSANNPDDLSPTCRQYYDFLAPFKSYLVDKPGKSYSAEGEYDQSGAAVRRASKLMANRKDAGNIHFSLKGIDSEKVCDKTKTNYGFTNSELRSIFRNYLKDGPNPHIFFYGKNDTLTNPPWLSKKHRKHWEEYKNHLEEKKNRKYKF